MLDGKKKKKMKFILIFSFVSIKGAKCLIL